MCSPQSLLTMDSTGRMMVIGVLCAMSAFLLANSAPTSLKSANDDKTVADLASRAEITHEKSLIRTKRAEEILYGNHQNAPRVKKSDPAAAPASPSDGDVGAKTVDSIKSEENDSHADTEEQPFPAEKHEEEQEEGDSANEQNSLEDIPAEAEESDYARYEGAAADDGSEEQEALRKKRSAKAAALMTAENMISRSSIASAANRPVRSKRDLDYEDLRQLLENARAAPYEVEEDEDTRPVAVIPMLPASENEGEDEEEVDEREEGPLSVALPYPYEPRYEEGPSEKEELIRELIEKKAEEDAKEKLIDYLLAAAIASEAEPIDGEEVDDDNGGIVVEAPGRQEYEVVDDEPSMAINPVSVKRNVFYPYTYEPYGGRWGAMVPGAKRSADEYERLYRLAEALNAGDEDYEEK